MNQRSGKKSIRAQRGNVPFAFVAVALLIATSAYCVVSSSVNDVDEGQTSLSEDMAAIGKSVEFTTAFVNRGLGEMIFQISTNADLGTLQERSASFRERSSAWLDFQFPLEASGITVELENRNISLRTEKLSLGKDSDLTEGYTPSFLKVTGTLGVRFVSESGTVSRTIQISSDGSCALPLSVEMGSLFENAVSGNGSILSQMVNYQLTSLAQYRVINGYGAMSAYGPKGTDSILTENDVVTAYDNAVRVLECMYFRDSGGKEYFGNVDLAKEIVAKNGKITINLNAIYAQALYAKVDDLVGKWFEYFLGNYVVDIFDDASDKLHKTWDSLVSFFTGKNNFSAEPYIREIIGNTYTGVRTGQYFSFAIPTDDENGIKAYRLVYPAVDLYGSSCIKDFKNEYRSSTNTIEEWMYGVANKAISNIAERKDMGSVTVDIRNTGSFSESLSYSIHTALSGNLAQLNAEITKVVNDDSVPDQFYAAIYSTIEYNKDTIFTYGSAPFLENILSQLTDRVRNDFSTEDKILSEHDAEEIIRSAFTLEFNNKVFRDYQQEVDTLMYKLNGLKSVAGSSSGITTHLALVALERGFSGVDCIVDVTRVANAMCSEYITNINLNPVEGFTELPTIDVFVLTGEDESVTEKLTVKDLYNPSVRVGRPSDKSSHEIGFKESADAAFCTVIPVHIEDSISLEIKSAGTMLRLLGISDSDFKDRIDVKLDLEISVVSGWALMGVEYQSSTNFLKDLYETVLSVLEPLLEPLRRLMEMAMDVLDKISQAVTMIAQYVNEYLEEIYNAVMGPIDRLNQIINDRISEYFCEQVVRISEKAEAIIDISVAGQTLGFTYMGYTLKFTFNLATLDKYTKHILKAEFEGNAFGADLSAFINVKTKGETKKTTYVTGGFNIKGDDWDLEGTVDPAMTSNKNFMTLSGTVRGVKIDCILPQVVQYNEIDISLSDFPGIGTILSNIPSPIPGTKISIDAGLNLKYSIPLTTGVLINEFEPNPEGNDADREWAEILNLSGSAVDLNDWTLTTSKGKVHIIKDVSLPVGGRTVIHFPGTFLVNNQEYLILKDPDGTEINRSATMNDTANDNRTCQRDIDGSTNWSLVKGTCGEANVGNIFGSDGIATGIVKDITKKAAAKAINEMRHVTTVEQLEELFVRTITYALDDGINRISNCLVEGSIYVSVDFTDLTSSGRSGFRAYVMIDNEIVRDLLKYLIGQAESLFLGIDDPYNISIETIQYDDVYFGVTVYGGIKTPSFLGKSANQEKVLLGVDIACNISALGALLNEDMGTSKVRAQIGIKNCPYELIPKSLGVKKNMTYDLWFIRLTFTEA